MLFCGDGRVTRGNMRALGFLLIAIVGVAAFEGCGSDSSTTAGSNTKFDAGTNACHVEYCPNNQGNATPCCVGTQCGFNYGLGCVAPRPDAGQ